VPDDISFVWPAAGPMQVTSLPGGGCDIKVHFSDRAMVRSIGKGLILKSGKPMGTVPSAGASWQELFDRGYGMVVGPHDVALLRDAATPETPRSPIICSRSR